MARGVFLTDAVSGVIIRETILPQFKEPATTAAGSSPAPTQIIKQMELAARARRRPTRAGDGAAKPRGRSGGAGFIPVIFIVIVFFVDHRLDRPRAPAAGAIAAGAAAGSIRASSCGASTSSAAARAAAAGAAAASAAAVGGGGGGGGFGGFSGGGGSFGGGGASGGW